MGVSKMEKKVEKKEAEKTVREIRLYFAA